MGQLNKSVFLRSFAASFTWLFITYLVWVSGICLSFLFTTSYFESKLCLNINASNMNQLLAFIAVLTSTCISVISLFVLRYAFNNEEIVSKPLRSRSTNTSISQ